MLASERAVGFSKGMENSRPFVERHFWRLLGAPLAIAALCVGYTAHSLAHTTSPVSPASASPTTIAAPAPKPTMTETAPIAPVVSQPMHEPAVEQIASVFAKRAPQKSTPAVKEEDRDQGFAKSEPQAQPSPPPKPAGRVAPDPTDMPYVVPANKPYLQGQNDPKPPAAAPAKPAPVAPKAPAAPPVQKGNERAIVKTFVLKDGRRIDAAIIADQGDSYAVEDGSGHAEEFLKSEVHLIISRR